MSVFRAGSTGFKLYVRTSRPLKRDEIEEVSKLLGEDINMYGPLEIGDREVTLVRKPEVVPTKHKSALGETSSETLCTLHLRDSWNDLPVYSRSQAKLKNSSCRAIAPKVIDLDGMCSDLWRIVPPRLKILPLPTLKLRHMSTFSAPSTPSVEKKNKVVSPFFKRRKFGANFRFNREVKV